MRAARAEDHWRHVKAPNTVPTRVRWFSHKGIPGLEDCRKELDVPLSVLCGQNGACKTTVLRAVHACLDPGAYAGDADLAAKLLGAAVEVGVSMQGKDAVYRTEFPPGEPLSKDVRFPVAFVEPAVDSDRALQWFKRLENRQEIVAASDSSSLSSDDVQLISYVVGKDYSTIQIYEVESVGDAVFPYFRVSVGASIAYGSEHMGTGEHAAFYLFWVLRRIERFSLLLIEEPEAHLSPRAQLAVANMIAKYVDEKKLTAIVSTHSAAILDRLSLSAISIFAGPAGRARSYAPVGGREHLDLLGYAPALRGIVFVEDCAAEFLLREILSTYRRTHLSTLSVVRKGGWSEVLAALRAMPREGHPLLFAGVLDGDQRGKAVTGVDWPVYYLPGTFAPDQTMVDVAKAELDQLGPLLGVPQHVADAAAAGAAGQNHHDWISTFAGGCMLQSEDVMRVLARRVVQHGMYMSDGSVLATEMARFLDGG